MSDTSPKVKKKSSGVFRKKDLDGILSKVNQEGHQLKKTLGAFDLTILGIGAIIGAGIFTLSGTAAVGPGGNDGAGPALVLSFILSGIICGITALCYAEFASMIPIAGSAYTYTYTTLGEIVAFMVGWVLILGYGIGSITVACGWSGYLFKMLQGFENIHPLMKTIAHPPYWMIYEFSTAQEMFITQKGIAASAVLNEFPHIFGIPISLNIPALFIVIVCTVLLYIGIQESARMAALMVLVKIAVIFGFIILGAFYVDPGNWTPFMPNGINGVIMGAFIVFFAYMGFDMVATTAEETKNPARDLPIGIITSLIVCTIIYILVALILTGMVPISQINIHSPIADAITHTNFSLKNYASGIIAIGAVAGLSSVILVQIMAVTRILFAMSRDGLLPKFCSNIHPKFGTPHVITVIVGSFIAFCTLFIDLNKAAELCNIGTLTAFTVVCTGVVILRYIEPDRERPFNVPFTPYLPLFGAFLSASLIIYTCFNFKDMNTLLYYLIWLIIGFTIYFLHGFKHSTLKAELKEKEQQQAES